MKRFHTIHDQSIVWMGNVRQGPIMPAHECELRVWRVICFIICTYWNTISDVSSRSVLHNRVIHAVTWKIWWRHCGNRNFMGPLHMILSHLPKVAWSAHIYSRFDISHQFLSLQAALNFCLVRKENWCKNKQCVTVAIFLFQFLLIKEHYSFLVQVNSKDLI